MKAKSNMNIINGLNKYMNKIKRIGYCVLLGLSIFYVGYCMIVMAYSSITGNYAKAIWNFICGIGWAIWLAIFWNKLNK